MDKAVNLISKRPKKRKRSNRDDSHVVSQIYYDEFLNIFTQEIQIVTPSYITEQARMLTDWSLLDDSLLVQDFTDMQGYQQRLFYKWTETFPQLKEALEFANSRIGSRREKGVMTRKFEASTTQRTLGYYQNIWKEETKRLEQEKSEAEARTEPIMVVIPGFGDRTIAEQEKFQAIPEDRPEVLAARVKSATVKGGGCHNNK